MPCGTNDDPPTVVSGDNPPVRRETLWVIVVTATLTVMAGAILGSIVTRIQSTLGGIGSGVTAHRSSRSDS